MKKLILIIILLTVIIPFTFSFSEESRSDLKRAAAWWGEIGDKLQVQLGDIGRKNPDPSNPNDKNWKEYLRITAEIQKAEEKQKLYEETSRFNYYRSISRDTAQAYKPIGDFIEFTADRGMELVIAAVTANWTDLVKLSVDSILKTRIRGKIRSILGCSETVPELENWLVVIGFGQDPWETTFDQALLNWAKGDADGKAMLLSLQLEEGRQIYNKFRNTSQKISNLTNPAGWLESATKRPAEEIMNKLGMVTFVADMAGKMWISYEMDESIDSTLQNLKAMKEKYKEKETELSCEDIFMVWSKQKSIDLIDPEEKKNQEELKLGLEYFLKKIPGWYSSKTIPDHFDEIVRMIPIAEKLGEHSTADNMRDILIEFEYKAMTPEEIAASELQSIIEESRGYLISNLKVLRNYLRTKQYEEVESQWSMTTDKWNELIEMGYDTDNDEEIQNLWTEIQYLLEQVPETTEYNDSEEDKQIAIIDNSTSSLRIPPEDEDKTIFIKYMWAFVEALNTGTQSDRDAAETELINFGNKLRAKGSVFQDIMNDGEIRSTLFSFSNRRITTRIIELADGSYKKPDSTSAENLDWSLSNSSGETTSNSGF